MLFSNNIQDCKIDKLDCAQNQSLLNTQRRLAYQGNEVQAKIGIAKLLFQPFVGDVAVGFGVDLDSLITVSGRGVHDGCEAASYLFEVINVLFLGCLLDEVPRLGNRHLGNLGQIDSASISTLLCFVTFLTAVLPWNISKEFRAMETGECLPCICPAASGGTWQQDVLPHCRSYRCQ